MGERKVISKLHLGDYGGVGKSTHMYVSAWLKDQEFARFENRHHQIIQSAKWTAYASWALALITLVLAGGTIWIGHMQLQDARETREQQSKDAKRIANAMEDSLGQSKIAFDAANKQAILTQRAWIEVKMGAGIQPSPNGPDNPFILGKPFDMRVSWKNTGRTPALNLKSVTKLETFFPKGGKFGKPNFQYNPGDFQPGGILEPNAELYGDFSTGPFTETDIKQITSFQIRVYIHGRLEFDDAFGIHHWRNFCALLLPTGAFSLCKFHNEIDSN